MKKSLQQPSPNTIPFLKFFSSLSLSSTTILQPPPPSPLPLPHTPPIKPTNPKITHLPNSPNPCPSFHPRDRLVSAHQLFAKILQPTLSSLTNDPISSFSQMCSLGLDPTQFDYGNALSACVSSRNIEFGQQVFSLVIKNGFFGNGYVVTGLVDLFSKSGRFDDALRVFEESHGSNVVCWNAIIAGGVRNGEKLVALDLFCRMTGFRFCVPNGFTFSSVLSACVESGELGIGRAIHGLVIKRAIKNDIYVDTCIVDLYAKCGDMSDAVKEFWRMPARNVVSWTAMIAGFVQKEDAYSAVEYFKEMIQSNVGVNKYTLTSVLLACSKSFMPKETMQIHCLTFKNGLFFMDSTVKDALISTYATFGNSQMSNRIFEEMGLMKNSGTWSAMISSLAQNPSFLMRASELFKRMFHEGLKPDKKCTTSVLSIVDSIEFGREIHSYVVKTGLVLDVLVASALFTMYSKCGSIEDSYRLFTQMHERDGVSWTSMVSGFAKHGCAIEAFRIFREMIHEGVDPDQMILSSVLMACYDSQFLMKGKEIHARALRDGFGSDAIVGSALVSMYSKCRNLISTERVFSGIPRKDEAILSSLVSAYSSNDYNEKALSVFCRMIASGFRLDYTTVSSVLGVCADLSKQILGKQLHSYGIKRGFTLHLTVSSALLTMYSKCGSVDASQKIFDEIDYPDLITWTALIDSYAQHGRGLEALKIFERMKLDRVNPDSVTLLSVLSACSHNGLVEEGFTYFNSMRSNYGIEPTQHHYASMVAILARSGKLREAADFIDKMPIEPDYLVWSTLLSACRIHGDIELGKLAAEKVAELEPRESGAYIASSNISAELGDWEEVVRIRSSMQGIKKEPGLSFV